MSVDIWELTGKLRESNLTKSLHNNDDFKEGKSIDEDSHFAMKQVTSNDTAILLLGTESSGKSTLMNSYLSKDLGQEVRKQPTSTLLSYQAVPIPSTSTTRGNENGDEEGLTHCWEIGSGKRMAPLIDLAITPSSLKAPLLVFVVVDLSRPLTVVDHARYWLEVLRKRLDTVTKESSIKFFTPINKLLDTHTDRARIQRFPVSVVLVGAKFDALHAMAVGKSAALLSTVGAHLRALAHRNGCSLLYTSQSVPASVVQFRVQVLRHTQSRGQLGLVSSSSSSVSTQMDYNKPLFIPAGSDSFAMIADPVASGSDAVKAEAAFKTIIGASVHHSRNVPDVLSLTASIMPCHYSYMQHSFD